MKCLCFDFENAFERQKFNDINKFNEYCVCVKCALHNDYY